MRTNIFSIFKGILTMFLLSVSVSSLAQIKYTSQGKLTVGNVSPYSFYPTTQVQHRTAIPSAGVA